MATMAVTTLVNYGLSKSSIEYVGKSGNIPISDLLQKPIAAVGTAINVGVSVKGVSDSKKLRAYYSHTRK